MITLCSPEIEVVEEGRDYSGAERLVLSGVNTDTITTGVLGRMPPAQAYLSLGPQHFTSSTDLKF